MVEDTDATLDDLRESSVMMIIVDGVTKLGKVEHKSLEEQLAENHRKMLMAMSEDIRVILLNYRTVCTICGLSNTFRK